MAAQALYFFPVDQLAAGTRAAVAEMRAVIPPYVEDRVVATDINRTIELLRTPSCLTNIEQAIGRLQ